MAPLSLGYKKPGQAREGPAAGEEKAGFPALTLAGQSNQDSGTASSRNAMGPPN